ncbi:MAG: Bug family tripartite tricarboxylate transporter substrate binding protein [Xanthobacteraceae bacterium]
MRLILSGNIRGSACALAVAVLGALASWVASARAEPWPQRTVRFIVPLPPGTSTDLVARLFADRLAERWRQPVVVENRQGGDGIPAVGGFVSARDDHTLLFSFAGIVTINPLIYDKLPYDPLRDLVPVAWVADNFIGVGVPEMLKVNSLHDFVQLARSQPGKLNWAASPGVPHYAFVALQKSAGIDMLQISYRDFRPALQDVGEGRIQAVATGVALMLPQMQAGKIKLLMVNNRRRSPQAPDVPTATEAGYPDITFEGAVGLYGWRDMASDLQARIANDVRAVAADPAIAPRVASMGSALRVGPPAEFAAAIEEQRAKIAAIARSMKPTQ